MIIDVTRSMDNFEYNRYCELLEARDRDFLTGGDDTGRPFLSSLDVEYLNVIDDRINNIIEHFAWRDGYFKSNKSNKLTTKEINWLSKKDRFVIIKGPKEDTVFLDSVENVELFRMISNPTSSNSELFRLNKKYKWPLYIKGNLLDSSVDKVSVWCFENCIGIYGISSDLILFEQDADLLQFKLIWNEYER